MHKFFLCLRYLRKRRIAFFGMMAVGLCVALLIVITSLFNGFLDSLYGYWRQTWGEIVMFPGRPMHDWEALADYLSRTDGVAHIDLSTNTGALLYLGKGNVKGVRLVGIDFPRKVKDENFRTGLLISPESETADGFALNQDARQKFTELFEKKFRREPRPAEMPVPMIVGIGLLGKPDEITDEYDLAAIREQMVAVDSLMNITTGSYSAGSGGEGASFRKIRRICWPVNVVQTGMHFNDIGNVYVPFDILREISGITGRDHKPLCLGQLKIYVQPDVDQEQVLTDLKSNWITFGRETLKWPAEWLRDASIYSSLDMANFQTITYEIRKQLAIMQLIMGFICLVASLLIFVILFMIVMQKKKDIGTIRALGATRGGIAGMFLIYGGGIGLIGSLIGLGLGCWATRNINLIEDTITALFGFKIWKSSTYLFSEIPNNVAWSSVQWIILAGIVTAMIGAVLPAWRAARLKPIEALRYE